KRATLRRCPAPSRTRHGDGPTPRRAALRALRAHPLPAPTHALACLAARSAAQPQECVRSRGCAGRPVDRHTPLGYIFRYEVPSMSPEQQPALVAGQAIGRYRVVRKMGGGGVSEVYEGFDGSMHRRVAIKVLDRRSAADDVIVARFFNEGLACNVAEHP